jgi:hypothetical protein
MGLKGRIQRTMPIGREAHERGSLLVLGRVILIS